MAGRRYAFRGPPAGPRPAPARGAPRGPRAPPRRGRRGGSSPVLREPAAELDEAVEDPAGGARRDRLAGSAYHSSVPPSRTSITRVGPAIVSSSTPSSPATTSARSQPRPTRASAIV